MENEKSYRKRRIITMIIMAIVITLVAIFGAIKLLSYHATDQRTVENDISGSTPTVVMFYRPTCTDCIKVEKTTKIAALKSKFNGSSSGYHDVYINTDTVYGKEKVQENTVQWTPTYMVFRNGEAQSLGKQNGVDVYQYTGKNAKTIQNIYKTLTLDGK